MDDELGGVAALMCSSGERAAVSWSVGSAPSKLLRETLWLIDGERSTG